MQLFTLRQEVLCMSSPSISQQHLSLILISCRVAKSRRSIWHRCSTKTEEKTGNLQIHMIYYEIGNLI